MNTLELPTKSQDLPQAALPADTTAFEETWFVEAAPTSTRRPTMPPVIQVGAFLGDPDVDAWLR
jgi:hypothetical protein